MAYLASGISVIPSIVTGSMNTFRYKTTDAEATVVASGYFNNLLNDHRPVDEDLIAIVASDITGWYKLSISGSTVTAVDMGGGAQILPKDITLAEGFDVIGNASGVGVARDVSTDKAISIGNGTSATLNVLTGPIALSNTGVTSVVAASIVTGSYASGSIANADIATNVLTGTVVANVADAAIIGGIQIIHPVNTAGGATADTDVTLTHRTKIAYVTVQNNGAGTASDTITIKNGANAITDAIDISGADKTIAIVGTIDDAQSTIAAAGTLRVTETDGGGSDSPATTVHVYGYRVAGA